MCDTWNSAAAQQQICRFIFVHFECCIRTEVKPVSRLDAFCSRRAPLLTLCAFSIFRGAFVVWSILSCVGIFLLVLAGLGGACASLPEVEALKEGAASARAGSALVFKKKQEQTLFKRSAAGFDKV